MSGYCHDERPETSEVKVTVDGFRTSNLTVGTSAAQLFSTNPIDKPLKGIILKAPGSDDASANTAPVYIGRGPNLTADLTSTGGFSLAPGESIELPFQDLTQIWAIAASSQTLTYLVV